MLNFSRVIKGIFLSVVLTTVISSNAWSFYNYVTAVNYAKKWATSFNTSSSPAEDGGPYWAYPVALTPPYYTGCVTDQAQPCNSNCAIGDATNFVSQCLKAGGINLTNTFGYDCTKLDSRGCYLNDDDLK